MKKIIVVVAILSLPFALSAQEIAQLPGGVVIDRGFLTGLATMLFVYLVVSFILSIIKSIQDYRLKSKLIEKGVPENIVEQFLQPTDSDSKSKSIKWFLVLAAVGLALTIINYTQPLGFHSVAIMAFCISGSFLGYYYYLRNTGKSSNQKYDRQERI